MKQLQLMYPPKLIRPYPRTWAYPVVLEPYKPMPVFPGVIKLLLGPWNMRDDLWGVDLKFDMDMTKPIIPTMLVVEIPPRYQFTLALFDWNKCRVMEII